MATSGRCVEGEVRRESNYPGYHYHERGQMIFCNVCGLGGYGGGNWMDKHSSHTQCEVDGCGRWVTTKGMNNHRATKHGLAKGARREKANADTTTEG